MKRQVSHFILVTELTVSPVIDLGHSQFYIVCVKMWKPTYTGSDSGSLVDTEHFGNYGREPLILAQALTMAMSIAVFVLCNPLLSAQLMHPVSHKQTSNNVSIISVLLFIIHVMVMS